MNFANKIIQFYDRLIYTGDPLPAGIRAMNPFRESTDVMRIVRDFYIKFYSDTKPRLGIFGINPGRFGGGVTGIPFTDPKRLVSHCGIDYSGAVTHEPSSVFVYDVIQAYGGPDKFYAKFYINSLCPLGFTNINPKGKEINYNYYDSPALADSAKQFIIENLHRQINLGVTTRVSLVLGTGKNEKYIRKLNEQHHFFDELISVEHPRYIIQYKSSARSFYIDKYLAAFDEMEAVLS